MFSLVTKQCGTWLSLFTENPSLLFVVIMDIYLSDIDENNSNEFNQFECKSEAFEYVNNVSDHLMCSICFNPMYQPKLLICGHTFCQSCIQCSINQNGRKCPICNQTV